MPIPIPFVLFEEMIADWFKDLQIYVDNLSPVPDGDNSMFPMIGIPYHFDTTVLVSATVSQFTDYTDSAHGYGYQNIGFSHRLTLINGDLRCTNLQLQGKILTGNPGTWSKLTDAEQADALEKAQQLLQVGVHNNYPDSKIGFSTYSSGSFGFTVIGHSSTDMHYKYTDKNGEHVNTLFTCSTTRSSNTIIDNGDGTISGPFSDVISGGRNFMNTTPTIVLFSSDTNAQNFVNGMQSTNRDVYNHVCVSGATYKLYVGETYLVYVIDPSKVYTFYDLYDGTKTAAQQINDWTPGSPVIKVPTYDDVKYGPEPEPGDYTDDNFGLTTTGFSSNIGGAGNYWLMDLTKLAGFISDFKTTAPAGSMISQNILSCYVNALNYEWETGEDNIVIHAAGAQNTPYTSTSKYYYIYQYNPHVIVGQYKVPRVTETFYDFNPYSTYELYIPFCGWIGLPDTVAGRNIRVYMDFDVATMSCKAYVMVEMEDGSGDTICGEITGSFGAPCPVQVIEGGLYKQAMINSGLQIASGVVSGLMGGAFGGPVGASMLATGGMNAVQGLASAYMAGNTNYGQTIGRAGDTSGLCGGHYCYIKITHPVIDEVVDTETFGHTTGYPCYMESELSALAGTGFTVCLNPHVHVNCTQNEKDEIKRLLESGVIL